MSLAKARMEKLGAKLEAKAKVVVSEIKEKKPKPKAKK